MPLYSGLSGWLGHEYSASVYMNEVVRSLGLPTREVRIIDQPQFLLNGFALEHFPYVLEGKVHHGLV